MQSREVPFSEFVKNVSGGEIRAVTLDGERVRFTGPDNREQFTIPVSYTHLRAHET